MNSFELFCLIFYALDAAWDAESDPVLGTWLSDANPFLFSDCDSAVSNCFADFEEWLGKREITVENSFSLAQEYVMRLRLPAAETVFSNLSSERWVSAAVKYLSRPHKGARKESPDA